MAREKPRGWQGSERKSSCLRGIKGYYARKDMPIATMERFDKAEIIRSYQLHEKDTGSADVQIAILTHRINQVATHLQRHRKDFSSRRGLVMMVNQRRKLLDYLHRVAPDRYRALLAKLNLRK